MFTMPINFHHWINQNRHLLKPPVGNKCLVQDDFIVMVVGGPNQRTDYHVEEGPEFFYQIEGDMVLRIQENDVCKEIPIRAGEVFYLPPKIPHSPQRMADSVGLVIERKRLSHEKDGLLWFCEQCNYPLYTEYFHLINIETQFDAIFKKFYNDLMLRTCKQCGVVHPTPYLT